MVKIERTTIRKPEVPIKQDQTSKEHNSSYLSRRAINAINSIHILQRLTSRQHKRGDRRTKQEHMQSNLRHLKCSTPINPPPLQTRNLKCGWCGCSLSALLIWNLHPEKGGKNNCIVQKNGLCNPRYKKYIVLCFMIVM